MPRPGYERVVLLTGYPSFYARRLLEQILANEARTSVLAIVPDRLFPNAAAHLDTLPRDRRERVEILEGDASSMDLGLSGAEFRRLTREVDRIHHAAHVTQASTDSKAAHLLNVESAREILELARATPSLHCLVHHSTASVSGDRTGVVYEEDLDAGQSFRTEIERTRMQAELLMRRAMREVPIAVVRPTSIVGDSKTGEIDRFDGVYLLVTLLVTMPADMAIPIPGKGDAPLNLVPIDYVVRAAHAIGNHPSAPGRTFHLADPKALSARNVFDLVARAGGRSSERAHIPSNVAKALLRTPGLERYMKSPRAFVEQIMTAVRYDTRNADAILENSDIACPPFESYVDALVAVVQDRARDRKRERTVRPDAELDADDPLS